MLLIPLGIGSAYSKAKLSWTCNLIDNRMLVDAAPQAMLQLRKLGISADDISGVLITHLHGDHVFGFPFVLAERSTEPEPLRVLGPEGTEERLTTLCRLAFHNIDQDKMAVTELPTGKDSEGEISGYRIEAISIEHSPESLGYVITDQAGSRLAYTGDAAWCDNLLRLIAETDANVVMTEMTFIEEKTKDHLTLVEHLPKLLHAAPKEARILLTHLSKPRSEYLKALRRLRRSMILEESRRLDLVEPAEEMREYLI